MGHCGPLGGVHLYETAFVDPLQKITIVGPVLDPLDLTWMGPPGYEPIDRTHLWGPPLWNHLFRFPWK